MSIDNRTASDSLAGFSSVLDVRKVSDPCRRAQLAGIINENRLRLLELLSIPSEVACCGDWTKIQKAIHAEIHLAEDEKARKDALKYIERLLDAEEELIEGNLRLVLMVVRRYTRGYMGALEEMDLVQEGCLGLLDAVRRFDFSGSRGFMAYAVIRIRKSVLLAMEKQQRLVRMPSYMVKKSIYLREVIDNFAAREGRYPLLHEIEQETGENLDIHLMLSLSEKVIPLDACVGDSDIPLSEQLQGNEPSPDDVTLNDILDMALQRLDERSKLVLTMRYGLLDGENRKLSSIAEVIGLSIERTRQIEKSSVKMLADVFRGYHFADRLQWD